MYTDFVAFVVERYTPAGFPHSTSLSLTSCTYHGDGSRHTRLGCFIDKLISMIMQNSYLY